MSIKVGLGTRTSCTPLSDDFSRDLVLNTIRQAGGGGSATVDYFNMLNVTSKMFKQLIDNAKSTNAGWNVTEDNNGLPLYYLLETDGNGDNHYVELQTTDLNVDSSNNVSPNDTTQDINGTVYNGIGTVTMTVGYKNTPFSTISWWLGVLGGTSIALKGLMPVISSCLRSIAAQISVQFEKLVANIVGSSAAEIEAAIQEGSAEADVAIAEEAGVEVAEIGAAELALGALSFVGIGLVVAAAFIVIALFVLHDSSQRVRFWNLTSYKALWTLWFFEGQMTTGPVQFNDDGSIKNYIALPPVERTSPVPGAKPTNQAHYGDFNFDSASETHGIGYAMQIQLVDPKDDGDVKYTCTLMYDIPFVGDNSTTVTFNAVDNLKDFYFNNEGTNKSTKQSASTSDGKINATTTYDYLSGQHVKPGLDGSDGNEAYYYQSVIILEQTDLK
ncbi:hypothetical protein Mapa_014528 [Marchantia paleacea]|nr:hypothetical protein Mapa_014528 [Marchantia paleacea]